MDAGRRMAYMTSLQVHPTDIYRRIPGNPKTPGIHYLELYSIYMRINIPASS